jgi:hypothetical protein
MSDKSDQFLKEFFGADGYHPNGDRARRLFEEAFVPPLKIKNLADAVNPNSRLRKVVIIDGHPRSGKTWSAVKVVADLVDRLDLSPTEYWTSGVDSLKVAPTDETTLLQSLRNAADAVSATRPLRLVFLDDLLGTNQLRPLDDLVQRREEIARFFRWNRENPFLGAMAESSVLVITGRSLHVTLMELLLGIDLRVPGDPEYVTVINPRRGLFRTSRKGDPFGTFNQESLGEVCRRNREYHPFAAPEDSDWLVMAAPLVAFDQEHKVSEAQKRFAAGVLFGDDLKCLADQINFLEAAALAAPVPQWLPISLANLRAAYLVMVAPGLVFLDPAAYRALGIEQELSSRLVRSLYLYESDGPFRCGRLPNEMYMLAVDDHLRDFLGSAARNFVAIARSVRDRGESVAPSLGLRGLIERALHAGGREGLARLLSVQEFRSYAESHVRDTQDPFLHLELTQSLPEQPNSTLTAGLVTAIGWSLHNFSSVYGPDLVKETVETWFPSAFHRYVQSKQRVTVPQCREAVIIYSTFLQWVLRICDTHQESGEAPDWAKPVIELRGGATQMRKSLEMVLEDEFVWAVNEKISLARSARAFMESKEAGLGRAISDAKSRDDELDANRFFSLAWHNEWMERTLAGRPQVLRQWMDSQRGRLQKVIAQCPELIAGNLSYHWCHFVTQRAVWMREWCFSDNPLDFERKYSQIARGSSNPSDNDDLDYIASVVLREGDADSIKTIMLLIGTRAARMPRFGDFGRAIQGRIGRADGAAVSELRIALLHAAFELVRQGFFDPFSEDTTEECRELCLEFLSWPDDLLNQAWTSYWGSLGQHTHHDVLPREEEGWKDVKEALQPRDQR